MPTRVAQGGTARPRTSPAATAAGRAARRPSLGGRVIAPTLPRKTAGSTFDTTRLRADGSLLLGRRHLGPGEVVLSRRGELLLEGKRGPLAVIETARLIETGASPFAHATAGQKASLVEALLKAVAPSKPGVERKAVALSRSAAATLLLSLARVSDGATHDAALAGYLSLLEREPNLPLKASTLTNLDGRTLR